MPDTCCKGPQMDSGISVITESLVNLFITSNCNSFTSEKRFPKDLTVAQLKNKLEIMTGASALSMKIEAFDKSDRKICELNDVDALLGSYPVDTGHRLHVEDTNKNRHEFENTALVEKFELSKEEYSKKENTVQAYLRRNKLGKYNEEEMAKLEAEKAKQDEEEAAEAAKIEVGQRCQVRVPERPTRLGEVMFCGKVHFKPGEIIWHFFWEKIVLIFVLFSRVVGGGQV